MRTLPALALLLSCASPPGALIEADPAPRRAIGTVAIGSIHASEPALVREVVSEFLARRDPIPGASSATLHVWIEPGWREREREVIVPGIPWREEGPVDRGPATPAQTEIWKGETLQLAITLRLVGEDLSWGAHAESDWRYPPDEQREQWIRETLALLLARAFPAR